MTKRTIEKRNRAIVRAEGDKLKIVGFRPAEDKTTKIVEYKGLKMMVKVSKGQIINPKKEWERRQKS